MSLRQASLLVRKLPRFFCQRSKIASRTITYTAIASEAALARVSFAPAATLWLRSHRSASSSCVDTGSLAARIEMDMLNTRGELRFEAVLCTRGAAHLLAERLRLRLAQHQLHLWVCGSI